MAANSTLLATQYATGVPRPRCHLPRNLVTKTPNTAIMAATANPALKYEAGNSLVSTPTQLHRNLVSKRDKTMVAAYPLKIELLTDTPVDTEFHLENYSGDNLKVDDQYIWVGPNSLDPPEEILNGQPASVFKHEADDGSGKVIGSVGALEYKWGDGKNKWIIAWSNPKNELNKVYTKIVEGKVDWGAIQKGLAKSVDKHEFKNGQLISEIEIDPTSASPKVKATLKKLAPASGGAGGGAGGGGAGGEGAGGEGAGGGAGGGDGAGV